VRFFLAAKLSQLLKVFTVVGHQIVEVGLLRIWRLLSHRKRPLHRLRHLNLLRYTEWSRFGLVVTIGDAVMRVLELVAALAVGVAPGASVAN
jgi:hypothetical protein